MVVGACTLTIKGEFPTSHADLKTLIDAQNLKTLGYLSGGNIIFVPVAGGNRVQVYTLSVATN